MQNINTFKEIDSLPLTGDQKEAMKLILAEKGSKALNEALRTTVKYSVNEQHAVEVLKAIYPEIDEGNIQKNLYHLRALGMVEGIKKAECQYCGKTEKITSLCPACLENHEKDAVEAETESISFREGKK